MDLHVTNRTRLCERLKSKRVEKGAIVLLQGGEQKCRDDTDAEIVFRQVYFRILINIILSQLVNI